MTVGPSFYRLRFQEANLLHVLLGTLPLPGVGHEDDRDVMLASKLLTL